MKKRFFIGLAAATFLVGIGYLTLYLWIKKDVKANVEIAQSKYGGAPEDALINFLQDESNSCYDRTHLATWTLGQIRSEKAYDILKRYYKNDPKGDTCYGNHEHMLCQYELYKAIQAIERRKPFSYASLK